MQPGPQASFPFIGIEEVREVPLAVLDQLHPVPAAFLKQARSSRCCRSASRAADRCRASHS
jgi:hypothetical protein